MSKRVELKTVIIKTKINSIELKGTLKYCSKDYELYLDEPFQSYAGGGHLIYVAPVKYVIEKSEKPTAFEIDLIELSKQKLQDVYNTKKGEI